MSNSQRKKRWFVATLSIVAVITILVTAWTTWYLPFGRPMRVGSEIQALGGKIELEPRGPQWLRSLFGDEYFSDVTAVRFFNCEQVTDEHLRHLAVLSHLKLFHLMNAPNVTDDGMLVFRSLGTLERLYIDAVPITDVGIAHLKQLRSLKELVLQDIELTDRGAHTIEQFTSLECLRLLNTQGLTDSCMVSIATLGKLQELEIVNDRMTADSLARLTPLKALRSVRFSSAIQYHAELAAFLDARFPGGIQSEPLRDVLDFLRESLGMKIAIDDDALPDSALDAVVACDSTATLQSNLNSILDPLGLSWFLQKDRLWITTKSAEFARVPRGIRTLREANPQIRIEWDQ